MWKKKWMLKEISVVNCADKEDKSAVNLFEIMELTSSSTMLIQCESNDSKESWLQSIKKQMKNFQLQRAHRLKNQLSYTT
mmetsp:Transcript_11802/g.12976  ORF Transcript_11802/g.12976 Transcript_11802/m.12976 type:complete len:80 (+) Transcript_11802:1796-2035(+)